MNDFFTENVEAHKVHKPFWIFLKLQSDVDANTNHVKRLSEE